ncbi:MAG: YfhO family protein [Candidatus Andersenbacteria bacterium]
MSFLTAKIFPYFLQNRAGLALLFLTWLIFFSPLIIGGKVYFLDDLKIIYYPLEQAYAEAQAAGTLPLWNNEFGFGHPLLAWGQLGFFTPLHLLLRALQVPPLWLLQISVVTYYAAGLLGMFVWLRRRVSSMAAALGSIVYVFSGFHIGHLNHVNFYTATMVLPWLILSLDTFIVRPTIRKALLVSSLGAIMALSGQPQIVLYAAILTAVIALFLLGEQCLLRPARSTWAMKIIGWGLLSVVIALALSSFALLPLYELLPQTERNDALPESVLYEFSYPPYHAVTLLLPYFFGDHAHYWGPKGFQELAAYVGIIPLLLTGLSVATWSDKKALRLGALTLLIISISFALGRYSPLYVWLVQQKFLTSLAVPGRFVFFFDFAIVLLSAIGLDDLLRLPQRSRKQRLISIGLSLIVISILMAPLLIQIQTDTRLYERLLELVASGDSHGILALLGLVLFFAALAIITLKPRYQQHAQFALLSIAALTLIVLGWHYNPRVDRTVATTPSPFTRHLEQYRAETGLPARLYSAESILAKLPTNVSIRATERISPSFTVHQLIKVRKENLSCLQIPVQVNHRFAGTVHITLREDFTTPILQAYDFPPDKLSGEQPLELCFPILAASVGKTFVLSFASELPSPLELSYTSYNQEEEPAYFVRVANPTPEQLRNSKKQAQIIFTSFYPHTGDLEATLLARHLNVTAGASSARWIGALSLGNYRAFIEHFFANDREPFDGDGIHALVSFRHILNMAGVTHLIQSLPLGADDSLLETGYTLLAKYDYGPKEVRLYRNPSAFPKAFLVNRAIFKPAADETRYAMQYEPYDPQELVYIDGPTPPTELSPSTSLPAAGTVKLLSYTPRQVEVEVNTSQPAFLVVSDSTTPQWQTFIDNQPAPYFRANSIFKAAQVSSGNHIVSFRYFSPAVAAAQIITLVAIGITLLLALLPSLGRWYWRRQAAAIKAKPRDTSL